MILVCGRPLMGRHLWAVWFYISRSDEGGQIDSRKMEFHWGWQATQGSWGLSTQGRWVWEGNLTCIAPVTSSELDLT